MKSKVFESKLEILSMYVVVGLWLIGVVIVVFAPVDILDRVPALKACVDRVLLLVGSGDRLGKRSDFPQVTRLYHALLVWTVPFLVVISHSWLMTRVAKDRDGFLFKPSFSVVNKVCLILLLPIYIVIIYFASLNHGGDTRLFAFGTSRWALGLFGIAFPLAVAAMVAAIIFSVRRVFLEDKIKRG